MSKLNGSKAAKEVFADETAQKWLADVAWDIEFQGYLTNHVKHAIIALKGLDAPKERIDGYWKEYTSETPYGIPLDAGNFTKPSEPLKDDEWKGLIGKKKSFSKLCYYFEAEIDKFGSDAVVKAALPLLIDGIPGALTHGIIHCGWGLASGSKWMTIEGLAYLAFSHVSVMPERYVTETLPGSTPMESLLYLADHKEEFAEFSKATKADVEKYPKETFHPELVVAGFQWQVAKILDAGHPLFYQKPTWLENDNLLEDMYDLVSTLHVVSKGNFLILHLVTSLWGLEQALVAADDPELKIAGLRAFWITLQGLLTTSGGGFPSRADIEAVITSNNNKYDDPTDSSVVTNWSQLAKDAIYQIEEHNIKLVYVEKDLWERYDYKSLYRTAASYFCETPNISPTSSVFST